MEMQDKEFDQLFNSKLGDFEMEPSAHVWQNITRDLDGKKAKRSIMPYLGIAASVIVLACVSVLFLNKTVKKPHQPVTLVKVKPVKPLSTSDTSKPPVEVDNVEDDTYLKEKAVVAVEPKKPVPANKVPQVEQVKEETILSSNPVAQKTEPVLANATVEKPILLRPQAPDTEIGAVTATLINQPKTITEAPGSYITDPIPEKSPEKKRAHGLGGFFNTIIAAVDKREDKLIEFTDANNDEGTRITGVNLGIFKIKKQ
ncbi:hypothetical protein ACFQZS_16480 [Mucilaginibacter calamicampi]|uniref:Energy transducer TonB n=1 Tax=Mucilaginibacter calamicampi TaxID=1302352 RepID=A0ABW2Z1L0_9SPHI